MGLSITMTTALLLTLKLALVTVFFLFILCIPLCYWLIAKDNFPRKLVLSICTLPLVLPPTVLGFYLILLLRPEGFVSLITNLIGIETLLFSFEGLVVGSIIYSLPFVLQPLYTSLKTVPHGYFDTLKILGYTKFNGYMRVILPMIRESIIAAMILGFLHTIGEFGVILMIGGNIPNETGVASIYLFDLVESFNYTQAHALSLILLLTSFSLLLFIYSYSSRIKKDD